MARWTSRRTRHAALGGSAVAGLLVLHRLGTTYGSTPEERDEALPGDDLVPCAQTVATHARTIADGPPRTECGFVVRDAQPGRLLVLHSTTHLPLAWRLRGRRVAWSWSFTLLPVADGAATRRIFR
jgi:hypothetical protein